MARVKPASASLSAMPRPMPRVPPVISATLRLSPMVCSEESVIAGVRHPADQQAKLEQMVVSPHAGLAAGNLRFGRNVVPPVRPVINAVQQQPFMIRLQGEIGFLEQPCSDGQPSGGVEFCTEYMSKAKQSLGGDRAGG